jgi:hypothetical protein
MCPCTETHTCSYHGEIINERLGAAERLRGAGDLAGADQILDELNAKFDNQRVAWIADERLQALRAARDECACDEGLTYPATAN